MWKKIVIGICCVVVTISLVIYYQIQRINAQLAQALQQHHVTFRHLDFALYPTTQLTLSDAYWQHPQQDAKVRSIFAEKLHLELDFWSLLTPQYAIKTFSFEKGKLWSNEQTAPEFSDLNGKLTGDFLIEPEQVSMMNMTFDLQLDRPLFFNTTQIQLSLTKGMIQRLSPLTYQLQWDDVQFNGEYFPLLKAKLEMASKQGLSLIGEIDYSAHQHPSHFSVSIQPQSESEKNLQLQAENLVLEQWLKVLNLPVLISGSASLSGQFRLVGQQAQQGHVEAMIQQGELKGLNLLTLVANYLPINLDKAQFSEKRTDTAFDKLNTNLTWQQQTLVLNALSFETKEVLVSGVGRVDLSNMQCDIKLNLALNQPNYSAFKLPIHFFDHCRSPRYKVEWNKQFRHQLKDLLKQKFR
ncbi:AsmA-like C-terminal region-containing protein [Pasteurella sp. PK-2025]|uniref:AsmA-like C-terminal region-containing protein n=1 Tax=Pasteurella sp. PK-2025 TaxID=3413133 RepID=UPI003C7236A0